MSSSKNTIRGASVVALALSLGILLTGCGGEAHREIAAGTLPGPVAPNPYPNPYPYPAPSPVPTSGVIESLPPLTYSFSLTGVGGKNPTYTTPAIQTDSILRVKVQAGPAGQLAAPNVSYSNFSATYNCISYTVTAIGQQVVTQPLNVGYGYGTQCAANKNEQVIDFSGRLTPGHGNVSIQISAPRYDFYCSLFQAGWVYGSGSMVCPLKTVYRNHTVTGTLQIQVNGTSL